MWTKKEDDILKEEISKSPNNLANAFRNAIKRLKGKSYATCSARWYYVLSKQDKVFSLESNNSSVVNTKNGATKQPKSSIPDKNSSKEELLEYARKNYPVGTKVKSNTIETKPKQKGVFLDVNKLESLSITFLRELAVTKLVDIDKKKLIDLIVE